MNLEEALQLLGDADRKVRVQSKMAGVKNRVERKSIWVDVEREKLRDIVQLLIDRSEDFPHFCVASTSDLGEIVEVNYHFTVNFGKPLEELQITFKVSLQKKDLWVPTLTDLVPAAIFSAVIAPV